MSFDLAQYELEDTAVLSLKDAHGSGDLIGADGVNPAQVRVYSPGSEKGVKALHVSSKGAQMRLAKTLKGDISDKDAERADEEAAEKLARITAEFINFPAKPIDVYRNPKLVYIAKQVDDFFGKYGNFCKGSSAS